MNRKRIAPDSEGPRLGVDGDENSENAREVILSEIQEDFTEKDLSEDNEDPNSLKFTRDTLEVLVKCLSGYLQQAQQNPGIQEDLIDVERSEELENFLHYVRESGVSEMFYILQRNRVLHEENLILKKNLKKLRKDSLSMSEKSLEFNGNLSIGSRDLKRQASDDYGQNGNLVDSENYIGSKSIIISDMGSVNLDTPKSVLIKKPSKYNQEVRKPSSETQKDSAKKPKDSQEEDATSSVGNKLREDLGKIILEKSLEIDQLISENQKLIKEKEEIEIARQDLEKTCKSLTRECELAVNALSSFQETNKKLANENEDQSDEIKRLTGENKANHELVEEVQKDLDALGLQHQTLLDKHTEIQENNDHREKLRNAATELQQHLQSHKESEELIAKLQAEQDTVTAECEVLLKMYNELKENHDALEKANADFAKEVQDRLEDYKKAQDLIKTLEQEKNYSCNRL